MEIGEAVVSSASQGPKGGTGGGVQAVCSIANCERLTGDNCAHRISVILRKILAIH